MKERYTLPLNKREAKQLFYTMLLAEDTKKKLPKTFWKRHEKIVEKLQAVIYSANATTNKIQKS